MSYVLTCVTWYDWHQESREVYNILHRLQFFMCNSCGNTLHMWLHQKFLHPSAEINNLLGFWLNTNAPLYLSATHTSPSANPNKINVRFCYITKSNWKSTANLFLSLHFVLLYFVSFSMLLSSQIASWGPLEVILNHSLVSKMSHSVLFYWKLLFGYDSG